MTTTTYCEKCGSATDAPASFCANCGSALSDGGTTKPAASHGVSENGSASQPRSEPAATMRGIVAGNPSRRRRSVAWIYYTILAVGSLIGVFAGKPIGLLGVLLFGGYASYLYNGGRFVIWFW
jgi:hypothetical protein